MIDSRQKELVKQASEMVGADDSLFLQASLVATENMRAAYVLKMFLRERIYKVITCALFLQAHLTDSSFSSRLSNSPNTISIRMICTKGCIQMRSLMQKGQFNRSLATLGRH